MKLHVHNGCLVVVTDAGKHCPINKVVIAGVVPYGKDPQAGVIFDANIRPGGGHFDAPNLAEADIRTIQDARALLNRLSKRRAIDADPVERAATRETIANLDRIVDTLVG